MVLDYLIIINERHSTQSFTVFFVANTSKTGFYDADKADLSIIQLMRDELISEACKTVMECYTQA